MKVVALVSGGKDSCYVMMRCIDYHHEIVALANLLPEDDSVDEMDSYMYQTVGHQIVISYSECMGLPLFRRRIHGSARHKDLCYKENLGDEVEDMYVLLNEVKQKIPSVTAVCSGAIASDYQRLRVESVCSRLNLVSLAYLWKQDQTLLLDEMVKKGIVAIIIKVAAMGLNPTKHLGKTIADMQPSLLHLKELYGINVCGEGGEYESLTLDCPLFKNARIILENFQIIPHSMDSIAPVGILHPVSFYSERKNVINSMSNSTEIRDTTQEKIVDVYEVLGVHRHPLSIDDLNTHFTIQDPTLEDKILHISTAKGKTFSVGCWISSSSNKDVQEDLEAVLRKIELRLGEDNLGWVNVIYIHLYISDMKAFTLANEVYLRFITEDKCRFGVPSRSTIELPLTQVNLGNAYIEVLVAEDLSKRVLHVQSISCWAPSCIGPYSQATLHKEILFMAGQLGLDPPTMLLCSGGAIAELDQALKNCEAVAESFDCSIASSAISLLIYCSTSLTVAERIEVEHRKKSFLHKKISETQSTIFLYVLAPNLPKSAVLEIKPLLYVPNYDDDDDDEALDITNVPTSSYPRIPNYWDSKLFDLNDSCCQKFIISRKICAVAVSVVNDVATEICSITERNAAEDFHCCNSSEHLLIISRFCLYLLHQTLVDVNFCWSELMNLRIYVSTAFCTDIDMLNGAFSDAFAELAETNSNIHKTTESMFTLIPVLGSGRSASMNDLVTCELLALKS